MRSFIRACFVVAAVWAGMTWADDAEILQRYRETEPENRQEIIDEHTRAGAHRLVGELALGELDRGEQGAAVEKARQLPGEITSALVNQGKLDEAQRLLRAVIGLAGPEEWHFRSYDTYLWFANCHDKLDEEVAWWTRGVEGVEQAHADRALARLHYARGDWEAAGRCAAGAQDEETVRALALRRADYQALAQELEATPQDQRKLGTLGSLGFCYRMLGKEKELEEIIARIGSWGRHSGEHVSSGWVLILLDRPDEALKFWLDVGHFDEAFHMLYAQELYDDAYALLREMPDHVEDVVALRLAAARGYLKLGTRDAALAQAELCWREVEENRNFSKAILVLGFEREAGLRDQAREHLLTALGWQSNASEPSRGTLEQAVGAQDVDWRRCWDYYGQVDLEMPLADRLGRIEKLAQWKALDDARAMVEAIAAEEGAGKVVDDGLVQLTAAQMKSAGDEAGAREYLAEWAHRSGKSALLWKLADWATDRREWGTAADLYQQIWAAEPCKAHPLAMRAWALSRGGREPEAAQAVKLGHRIVINGERRGFYNALATGGLTDHARLERDAILKITSIARDDGSEMAWKLGEDLLGAGKAMEAAAWFERALWSASQNTFWYGTVGEYLQRMAEVRWARARGHIAQGNIEEALAEVENGLRLMPASTSDQLVEVIGDLRKAGRRGEADQIVRLVFERREQICEQSPDCGENHNLLAWFGGACGFELERSLAHARRAVEIDAENAAWWDSLAVVLMELKRKDEAVAAQRKAVELDPDRAEFRERLARFEKGQADSSVVR